MEVDNLASFGCTVTKGEEMLQKCGPRIGDYDYTVLEFGGNDCDFDWKSVSDDPEASHICKTPLETFKQKYARMLETIKRFGRQAGGAESAADRFGTLFSLDQPESVAVAHPAFSQGGRLHRPLAGDVQHRGGTGGVGCRRAVIDIRSAFLAQPDFRSYLCADGIHPNEAGQKLIYGAIRRQLPSAT